MNWENQRSESNIGRLKTLIPDLWPPSSCYKMWYDKIWWPNGYTLGVLLTRENIHLFGYLAIFAARMVRIIFNDWFKILHVNLWAPGEKFHFSFRVFSTAVDFSTIVFWQLESCLGSLLVARSLAVFNLQVSRKSEGKNRRWSPTCDPPALTG